MSETSSGDKQELPLSNFQKPNLLLQKEKKRRHSAVEDVAEEEGTRVETHNSILSLVCDFSALLQTLLFKKNILFC